MEISFPFRPWYLYGRIHYINVSEYRRGNKKTTDNPEKLATYGTQDKEKQSKNTTQYVLDTSLRKQS